MGCTALGNAAYFIESGKPENNPYSVKVGGEAADGLIENRCREHLLRFSDVKFVSNFQPHNECEMALIVYIIWIVFQKTGKQMISAMEKKPI